MQANDPHGMVDAVTEARDRSISKGAPQAMAEYVASQFISKAHDPGAVAAMIQNSARSNAGPALQGNAVNASLTPITTNAGTQFAQLQPGAPNAVTPIGAGAAAPQPTVVPAGVSPTQTQANGSDVLGRPILINTDQQGRKTFQSPPGANYQPMMAYPAGEGPNTLPEVQKMRTDAQKAAMAAPQQHFLTTQIINTAPAAFTGSNALALQRFFSAFGGAYDPENKASASSQLQHFIALSTVNNSEAAGANTDATKATIAASVLPTDAPEKAIPIIARINDAIMATGAQMKFAGMQKAIQTSPNDIFAARQFNTDWSNNADPQVLRLINAGNNPALLKEVRDSLGTNEQQRAANLKALMPKYLAIKSLTTTGMMPPTMQ